LRETARNRGERYAPKRTSSAASCR
jgi:hypothetical protein